jgi:hypothetical protein
MEVGVTKGLFFEILVWEELFLNFRLKGLK